MGLKENINLNEKEQKNIKEKSDLHLIDLTPYFGLTDYIHRNTGSDGRSGLDYSNLRWAQSVIIVSSLWTYNIAFSWCAMLGILTGIEKILQ